MNKLDQFNIEVSPALVLIDVLGRSNCVATPEQADVALALADELQAVSGSCRIKVIGEMPQEDTDEFVLLYYHSDNGPAGKDEIARAAQVIARSEVRNPADLVDGETHHVTGARAVVHPELPGARSGAVVFMVSTNVWFNKNRVTAHWPNGDAQDNIFLDDINERLGEGEVSLAR
ncbi:hypothetical protein ACEUZ9_001086 [Paracoccus litorisediminis]|uniref:hypothetical protein n=1 Tax=Paracoccus litorisediminis TaxID=2006130 RepID=UPI00372F6F3F